MSQGLPRKLRYAFVVQAVIASIVIVIGIYAAGAIIKEVMSEQRLRAEAESFWSGRAADPAYPLPNTSTITAHYLPAGASVRQLPEMLRGLSPGIFELPQLRGRLLVDERAQGRLYLGMSFIQEERLIFWAGFTSMLLSLLVVYAVSWLTYRNSKRLVVPVKWLADEVTRWNPVGADADALSAQRMPGVVGSEVRQLGGALHDLSMRMREFVRRERDFTHDASHELRTPLTVIRVATDMMLADPETRPRAQRSLTRMQHACRDMEAVIDAFLILAREDDGKHVVEEFAVSEVVDEEVAKVLPMLSNRPVQLRVVAAAAPRLHASPRVLAVMLGHLLENACVFTRDGQIDVVVERDRIVVRDSGIGMTPEVLRKACEPFYRANQFSSAGKGMGLSIVHRLGLRFGWPVTLTSTPGEGTTAIIGFAQHVID